MVERPLCEHRALVQHRHAAIQPADELHVLFDHDDRVALGQPLQQGGGVFAFLGRHARGGLINQKQARVLRQQHPDLEPLLLPVAQDARLPVEIVAEADLGGDFGDARAVGIADPVEHRGQRSARLAERDAQVVPDALILEDGGALELAPDAGLRDLGLGHLQERLAQIAPAHGPLVGSRLAGDDIHEGGLARPVRPDHRAQLGAADGEAEVVDRAEAVEADRNALHLEKRAHGLSFRTIWSTSPPSPFGAKSVTSTKPRPSSTGHQSTHSIRKRPRSMSGARPPVK